MLTVSQNTKIYIILTSSLIMLVMELMMPVSFFISMPFAQLVYATAHSLGLSSVRLVSASLLIDDVAVDFTDLCTGVPAIVLSALFLWLGGISKTVIVTTSIALVLVNMLRSILVAFLLVTRDYAVAAAIHNASYGVFTGALMLLMLWSMLRALRISPFKRDLLSALREKTLKTLKRFRSKKAVSPLIATILLVGVAIVASVMVAGWTLGWFRGAGGAVLEGMQTRIYFDPSTGKGKIHIRVANTGTGPAQIRAINITGEKDVKIVFDTSAAPFMPKPEAPTGKTWTLDTHYKVALVGSIPTVAITADAAIGTNLGVLNLPANSYADIVLEFTSATAANNLADVFKLGGSYRGTVWPKTGTGASPTDFTVRIESYTP